MARRRQRACRALIGHPREFVGDPGVVLGQAGQLVGYPRGFVGGPLPTPAKPSYAYRIDSPGYPFTNEGIQSATYRSTFQEIVEFHDGTSWISVSAVEGSLQYCNLTSVEPNGAKSPVAADNAIGPGWDGCTNVTNSPPAPTIAAVAPFKVGDFATLDASGGGTDPDPDHDTVTSAWTQVSSPTDAIIRPDPDNPYLCKVAMVRDGEYVIQVVMTDQTANLHAHNPSNSVGQPAKVTLTVNPANGPAPGGGRELPPARPPDPLSREGQISGLLRGQQGSTHMGIASKWSRSSDWSPRAAGIGAVGLAALGLTSLAGGASGGPDEVTRDDLATLARLDSPAPRDVSRAAMELYGRRDALIEKLIARLDSKQGAAVGTSRSAAAMLLGRFRAQEGVPALIRTMLDPSMPENGPFRFRSDIDPLDDAAWAALVRIGRPSAPALLGAIGADNDANHRQRAVDALAIVVADKRLLLDVLAREERRAADPRVAARFRAVADWAKGYYPDEAETSF